MNLNILYQKELENLCDNVDLTCRVEQDAFGTWQTNIGWASTLKLMYRDCRVNILFFDFAKFYYM